MNVTVRSVEAIPLRYQLRDGGYGSSRGIVVARETTLVRLETNEGVTGWGEAWGPPLSTVPLVNELAEGLAGATLDGPVPFVTNRLHQHYHRGGGLFAAALSGVEIALWDALGRTLGVNVATLLGGRAREYVTPYASAGFVTPDRDVEKFRDALSEAADGFAGAKIKCGLGVAEDVERTAVAREVLGPDRALMVDINGNYTADQAIASARALHDLQVTWLEEPLPPDDVDGLRLLRGTHLPLATGEALYTRAPFRRLVTERMVDFVQPDVTKVGGLAEARAICELARAWNIRVSPHVWGGGVGLSAALQLLASIPDYPHTLNTPQPLWLELDRGDNALRDLVLSEPLRIVASQLAVPGGPGLGIDVDTEAIERLRADR
jgi:D-galactarolactone cycloisomerase